MPPNRAVLTLFNQMLKMLNNSLNSESYNTAFQKNPVKRVIFTEFES